ncbi:MAG: hypothetical protein E7472_04655 [Ruminococcaceae bacterium]|nr:hypothetical protein [Oscillospiraceae bacterium]
MKCYVIGKRKLDFTASDGKEIKGLSLFLGWSSDSIEGMETARFYVSESKLPKQDIQVGADIEVYFDRRGKIDSIVVD